MPKQGTENRPAGACAAPCARCGAAQAERLASVLVELRQVLDELPARVAAEVAAQRAAPAVSVAMAKLLRDTRAAFKGEVWAVRDLRAHGLLQGWAERNSRIGQMLSEQVGKKIEGLRLIQLTPRPTNEGRLYRIEVVDGDDEASSSPAVPDTMRALQLAPRKSR